MIKKILLGIDGLLLFLFIIVGIDYSYYIANIKYVNDAKTVILTNELNLNIENREINFNKTKIGDTLEVNFTIENVIDKETNFNILFNDITNDYGKNLIYELYEGNKLVVSNTVAPQNGSNSYIKLNINIEGSTVKNYILKFTLLNRENEMETEFVNKRFKATLNINSLQIKDEIKTATNYILATNNILEENNEIENGLFKTNNTNSNNASYYYKGNVLNNYVSFNNELWRIIRINENGSIRLIKDENLINQYQYTFNSKQDNANDYLTSDIKKELDNYYDNNLQKFSNMLEESNYCTVSNVVKNDNYKVNESSVNYSEYIPNLKCSQQNILKIGLISYDEAMLAGLNYTSSSNNNYLTNGNNKNTWTLSPAGLYSYNNENYVWKISDRKTLIESNVSNKNSIRPVINIKGTLNITGNGTIDNPYIFIE